jgi:hypothetical protein
MATYTVTQSKTITLVSGQVDTVTLNGTGVTIRVSSDSTTVPVSFTVSQALNTPATPTDKGDNCYVVLSSAAPVEIPWTGNSAKVSVIATGTPTVNIALIG